VKCTPRTGAAGRARIDQVADEVGAGARQLVVLAAKRDDQHPRIDAGEPGDMIGLEAAQLTSSAVSQAPALVSTTALPPIPFSRTPSTRAPVRIAPPCCSICARSRRDLAKVHDARLAHDEPAIPPPAARCRAARRPIRGAALVDRWPGRGPRVGRARAARRAWSPPPASRCADVALLGSAEFVQRLRPPGRGAP